MLYLPSSHVGPRPFPAYHTARAGALAGPALVLLLVAGLLGGCASTGPPSQPLDDDTLEALGARVVAGLWTYEATGSRSLSRGTLMLHADNEGRLSGVLRDARAGDVRVQGRMRGRRLVLEIGSGLDMHATVQRDRFTGALEQASGGASAAGRSTWDVRNRRVRRYGGSTLARLADGAFYAERGDLGLDALFPATLDCHLTLYEDVDPC
jgi:hypothetical protein